jgi:hypothetical protein
MMFLEKNVRTFDVTFSSSYGACAPRFDWDLNIPQCNKFSGKFKISVLERGKIGPPEKTK